MQIEENDFCDEDIVSLLKQECARLDAVRAALLDSELPELAHQVFCSVENIDQILLYLEDDWGEDNV